MSRLENISDFKCSAHHFQHVLPCSFVYIKTPETWPTRNYCYLMCVEAARMCHWPRFPSFWNQGLFVVFLMWMPGYLAREYLEIRFSVSPGHALVQALHSRTSLSREQTRWRLLISSVLKNVIFTCYSWLWEESSRLSTWIINYFFSHLSSCLFEFIYCLT